MKVIHICLACFYIDGYAYQENMLPKYHKKMGYEVSILASLVSYDEKGQPCLLEERDEYINEYGIPVKRIPYRAKFSSIAKILRIYNHNTYNYLIKEKPDIIFIHGCQFLDIKHIARYAKENKRVKIYVDNHSDFSNSATNWLSKNIFHKIIWKYCAHLIEPFTKKFYGVLPARVDFLNKIYKIPKEKIKLLVMGADDDKVLDAKDESVRKMIREKYNIEKDDFLIITGGKIDNSKKQTLLLMQAVQQINKKNVKLIVFGSVVEELRDKIKTLADGVKVQYIGWIFSEDSYNYFAAADLVVFPGRHSVFWEQVVGQGIPMIVKHWDGTTHINLGGNVKFLYGDSVEEIKNSIVPLHNKSDIYKNMRIIAETKGLEEFSYLKIAKKSIESL